MRSSLVVRASDCQCTSCNGPGFDPSIRRHSGIWGAADEAVLNKKHFFAETCHRFPAANVFLFHFSANNTGIHTYRYVQYFKLLSGCFGCCSRFFFSFPEEKKTQWDSCKIQMGGSICKNLLLDLKRAVVVVVSTKAVNRGDKRSRQVRDRDFAKFERPRRYRDRYRCLEKKSRRGRDRDLVFRDRPPPRTRARSLFAVRDSHPPLTAVATFTTTAIL